MPRQRKYTNAADIEKKIDSYFDSVSDSGTPPIFEDLLLHLDITRETWNSYRDPVFSDKATEEEKSNKRAVSSAIKKAEQRITADMVKYGLNNPNKQTLAIFLLKQKHYGGYTDKQEIEHKDLKIDIKINGVEGNPFA